ncbi:MAG TPA: PVC-type heme-binding CxxCH protein [Gemmataceae bacterium]|nr:PVC-type heme-binding CxxCH protein [Gemmataceae bacterium]
MRLLLAIAILALPTVVRAQEFKMEPPKSPADSLKCIKTRPGFTVELMVAEPLVMDPIAFAWGPDGKFWVVEMGDYPLGVDGKKKPGGRIKYLEKTKPDGPYDKMTVFMDGLGFPTGVFPYGKGVLVTCAPDIFYAEVGKDGKATKKEVLFTGFKEGNQQHRVNGLTWGLDNWIYGANGDSGGMIEVSGKRFLKPVNISGRDFRFKPGVFQVVSGQSQFGRCRDDWANWFGCNNSNPMFHYVLDDFYLKNNPHVLYPDHRVQVPVKPGAAEVFPISKPLPRFNSPQALNHFTSACSTIIYRDTLFGKEFEGNMFVSEPVHNLVHREIMKPKGSTFTSQRADDEQKSEFLASSDNWFRPTMIQVGPDGALWIADMYRYVIEHPEWIPKDWQKKLDLRAGHDKGRIYRVFPTDKKPRDIPRLDKMNLKELLKQMESPSGWARDTAHQILIRNIPTAADLDGVADGLSEIAWKSKLPQARVQAMHARDALASWTFGELRKFARDPDPAVRRHSLELMSGYSLRGEGELLDELAKEKDAQVRMQLYYRLEASELGDRLGRMLIDDANDPYLVAAGLSSINQQNWKSVFAEWLKPKTMPASLFAPAIRLARVYGNRLDASRLLIRRLNEQEGVPTSEKIAIASEMVALMEANNMSVKTLMIEIANEQSGVALARMKEIHAGAVRVVSNSKSSASDRIVAMRLLARGLGSDREDHKILGNLLNPRTPDSVQIAAIEHLGRTLDPRVPLVFTQHWKSFSPSVRNRVLDTLLSQKLWTRMTLDAVEKKDIPPQEIDAIHRQRLLQHKDDQVREIAEKLFDAASSADRRRIVDLYALQLPDKADRERGAKLFAKACATCHKIDGKGQDVGPDLASVGDKSVEGLLTAILDPNRAVETRYINYSVSTKAGLTFNGILQGETSTTITLVAPDGKKHQLLRNEIDELASTGKSLMPEGLEKDLTPRDIGDIIEYVRGTYPKPKRKEFPGNDPQTQAPEKDGIFRLLPASAAIYGPSIVLEKKYGNFGFWSSADDHVIWTLNVPKSGKYDVWIYYACAKDSAGNSLALQTGKSRLAHKVASTGTWDDYRGENIGELQISAGTQELILRGDIPIRGALIDLKKVELAPK